jgi:hypothetical protein
MRRPSNKRLEDLQYVLHSFFALTLSQYKAFWEKKDGMPTMWYGLLYSILTAAILVGARALPGGRDIPLSLLKRTDHFQNLAASAMALADVSRTQPYGLECLLIYTDSQYMRWGELPGRSCLASLI